MRQFLKKGDHLYVDAQGSTAVLLNIVLEVEFEGSRGTRFRTSWKDDSWTMNRTAQTMVAPGFDGTNGLKNPLGEDGFITDLIVRATFSGASKRGALYVRASIRSGGQAHGIPLAQGYLSTMRASVRLGMFEDSLRGRGLKIDNEADSVLVNNTALTRTITVPANARWLLRYGAVLNADNVDRGVDYIWDDGADALGGWNSPDTRVTVVAAQIATFPMTAGSVSFQVGNPHEIVLNEADRIRITWFAGGASAGGTAKSSAVVEEWLET